MFFENSEKTAGNSLICLSGISHRGGSVELRERFAADEERQNALIGELLESKRLAEAVVVSTCNRIELVAAVPAESPEAGVAAGELFFERLSGIPGSKFRKACYHFSGRSAVGHVFRVASGLDSMVLGEPQILGQLKSAYERARTSGTARVLLNHLFHRAFSVAKTVRSETAIGRGGVSVAFVARKLAEEIFGELEGVSVMLIGAGETGELALKHFTAKGAKRLFVVNRTLEKAIQLAERFEAVPLKLSQAAKFIAEVDIVIGAATNTGAGYFVSPEMVEEAIKVRKSRPQVLIDLGVPRNFSPEIANLPDAFLFNIDHLQQIADKNIALREVQLEQAEFFISEETERFCSWLTLRRLEPTIRDVVRSFDALKEHEIARSLRRLRKLDLAPEVEHEFQQVIERFSSALIAKILHRPLSVLREDGAERDEVVEVFRKFFLRHSSSRTR